MSLPFVSLDAATTIGPGQGRDLEGVVRDHTMVVSSTGGPTAIQVRLEGSHNGTDWVPLISIGSPSGPVAATVNTYYVRYVRANLTSLSGGTSPTATATIASAGGTQ